MEQAPELVPLMPRPSDRRKMHPNWQLWSKPAGDSANPRSNVTAGPEFCCFSYTSFQFVGCFFFRLLDFGTPNHRGAFFPAVCRPFCTSKLQPSTHSKGWFKSAGIPSGTIRRLLAAGV